MYVAYGDAHYTLILWLYDILFVRMYTNLYNNSKFKINSFQNNYYKKFKESFPAKYKMSFRFNKRKQLNSILV